MNARRSTRRRDGFSIIELLVVVSIIALLIALLLPALGKAKATAQTAVCASNLRQLGAAVTLYAQENRSYLPVYTSSPVDAGNNWHRNIWRYLHPTGTYGNWGDMYTSVYGNTQWVYGDNADQDGNPYFSYAFNSNLRNKKMIHRASVLMLVDFHNAVLAAGSNDELNFRLWGRHGGFEPNPNPGGWGNLETGRDGRTGVFNICYEDGHVAPRASGNVRSTRPDRRRFEVLELPVTSRLTGVASELRSRADDLHRLLEDHFYDPNGLMYSYLDARTRKPFTPDAVAGYPIRFNGAPALHDWFSHENTLMVAGNYLTALVHRARVEPDPPTDAMIDRVMACIRAVYRLGASIREPGWLCKPYGGSASQESTNDQYGGVIRGLRELALLPQHPLSDEARQLALSLCDYWVRHDYVCSYGGKSSHRWMGAHQWGLVTMAFVRVAYELSGDEKYAREAQRLCRDEKCDQVQPRSGNFLHGIFPDRPHVGVRRLSAYHFLVVDYLDVLLDAWPQRHDDWLELMRAFWTQDINIGVDDDGLQFGCYQVDTRTNAWRPIDPQFLFPQGVSRETASFLHHHWVGGYKSGTTTSHVPAMAALVGRRISELREECRSLALRILHKLDESLMTMVIDPTGDQEAKETGQVRVNMLDGRAPAQWLGAYWHGRSLGWWE